MGGGVTYRELGVWEACWQVWSSAVVPREVVGSQPDTGRRPRRRSSHPARCFLSAQRSDGLYSLCSSMPCDAGTVCGEVPQSLAVGNTQMYYSTCAGCSVSVASVMVSGRGEVLSEVQQELPCLSEPAPCRFLRRRLLAGSGFCFLPRGPLHMTACPVKLVGGAVSWVRLC